MFGDVGGGQGFVDGTGSGFLGSLIVPLLVVQDCQGFLELGYLG